MTALATRRVLAPEVVAAARPQPVGVLRTVVGLTLEVVGTRSAVGDLVRVGEGPDSVLAEVVATTEGVARCMPLGATHGLRPIRLADRCIFSWLRDPNGNWVEVVQYSADTGELPDITRAQDLWPTIIAWRDEGTPA